MPLRPGLELINDVPWQFCVRYAKQYCILLHIAHLRTHLFHHSLKHTFRQFFTLIT